MGKIFCLMGKSASGKDTIYKRLLADKGLKLNRIIPYTTRPVRENERDGKEYHFVTEDRLNELKSAGRVIECRSYDTIHGVWYYFTVADEQIDTDNNDYLIIGTPESFISMKRYYGNDKVVPIYIELDDGVRLQRALDREKAQSNPRYEEMCRRFLADSEDFDRERLEKAGIDKDFNNSDLEACIRKITDHIRQFRHL